MCKSFRKITSVIHKDNLSSHRPQHFGWSILISPVVLPSFLSPWSSPQFNPSWVQKPTWFLSFLSSFLLSTIFFWSFCPCPHPHNMTRQCYLFSLIASEIVLMFLYSWSLDLGSHLLPPLSSPSIFLSILLSPFSTCSAVSL